MTTPTLVRAEIAFAVDGPTLAGICDGRRRNIWPQPFDETNDEACVSIRGYKQRMRADAH
jgi:hypothetical protein